MFWCLEQLSIASKVLAVKFYIVFFDVRFFVSILCLMCKCSVRCVFSGRGRCLLRRDMISCLLCFLIYFFVLRCCFSLLLQSFFWPRGVRLLLFLRLVMGGQTYVVVAVAWRSLLFSLTHSMLHCCEILLSWKVGAYPAGGRTFGRLYPPGWIVVVRLAFSCVLSVCVRFFFLLPLFLVLLDSGPLFRGAACLDFCVKPKGARPTHVWEHVALNPRALLLGCVLLCWWFCFLSLFFLLSPPSLGFA